MIKFIKLTECKGGIIIINTAQIEHIILGAKGTDTYIKCKNNFFFVKESLEDIWLMLIIDNAKAPVIMTADEALKYYKND